MWVGVGHVGGAGVLQKEMEDDEKKHFIRGSEGQGLDHLRSGKNFVFGAESVGSRSKGLTCHATLGCSPWQ